MPRTSAIETPRFAATPASTVGAPAGAVAGGPGVTLTHHGAVTGVTGSCHELSLHGPGGAKSGILVDCGIFQGDEAAGRSGADEQTQDLTPTKTPAAPMIASWQQE